MGYVRAFREGDAECLAPILRDADQDELRAGTGMAPLAALQAGADHSQICCTIIDNSWHVAGMFGIVDEGDFGRIWMLGSDALTRPPLSIQFLRECRKHVYQMERPYRIIGNEIDQRNTLHVRWLKWLGFTFLPPIHDYGPERRTFIPFVKVVQPCALH